MKNLIPVYIYIAITYLFHIGVAMDKLDPELRKHASYWIKNVGNDHIKRDAIISTILAPITVPVMLGTEFSKSSRGR